MAKQTRGELIFRAACADERLAAARLLCQHVEADQREARAISLATLPGAEASVASRGEKLVAAVLTQTMPGRMGLIWSPQALADEEISTSVALVGWATARLAQQSLRGAQALTSADAEQDARVFTEAGYTRLSELLYLMSEIDDFPDSQPAGNLCFAPYEDRDRKRLSNIIAATYEGTLDCPQLSQTRALSDVIESYQAAGSFDPSRWRIVRDGGQDIGCLLLTEHASSEHASQKHWELIYMGLILAARGRALGVDLARQAQWMARRGGASRLTLTADASNTPALRAYVAAGFRAFDYRVVFWKDLA